MHGLVRWVTEAHAGQPISDKAFITRFVHKILIVAVLQLHRNHRDHICGRRLRSARGIVRRTSALTNRKIGVPTWPSRRDPAQNKRPRFGHMTKVKWRVTLLSGPRATIALLTAVAPSGHSFEMVVNPVHPNGL